MDQPITLLLQAAGRGDEKANQQVAPILLAELHQIAERAMARERRNHTLQATVLADEAYMRLVGRAEVDWEGRTHFYACAATAIRQMLVDHARRRDALKRGGGHDRLAVHTIDAMADFETSTPIEILALDEALRDLARLDERQSRIVELRFFGGLAVDQIAHVLGVSSRTVDGDWAMARAWLKLRLMPVG